MTAKFIKDFNENIWLINVKDIYVRKNSYKMKNIN